MWHSTRLSFSVWLAKLASQCGVAVQIPATPLLVQLPQMAWKMFMPLPPVWENWMEFSTPGLSLIQLHPLWLFGSKSVDGKSFIPSLLLPSLSCHSLCLYKGKARQGRERKGEKEKSTQNSCMILMSLSDGIVEWRVFSISKLNCFSQSLFLWENVVSSYQMVIN